MYTWIKYDEWKPMVELIPWEVLLLIWKILWYWAKKYWPNNRKNLENFDDRYIWAALRHIYKHQSWELFDLESWELHLAHALTNLIFLVYENININGQKLWK
jgi:hypothetical protein